MNTEHTQPLTVRSVGAPLVTAAAIALLIALVAAHKAKTETAEKRQTNENKIA